jgi:hypothetical protein
MVQLRCENPVRSCGLSNHVQGSRYWICENCGAIGLNIRE